MLEGVAEVPGVDVVCCEEDGVEIPAEEVVAGVVGTSVVELTVVPEAAGEEKLPVLSADVTGVSTGVSFGFGGVSGFSSSTFRGVCELS